MDVDSDQAHAASNVDDWLARFSPATGSKPNAFPFTLQKARSIESRRARMSDLLIFDVLLIRGGIRTPDMLFPPADWVSLRKLLDAIDQSVYDILKKDCLVYILLKWAWDIDTRESNPGWDARYLQDRCIAPQFAALADAYWLLDTGTHLSKAVSILSDARLNRDYVSKVLQALALSSSPTAVATGTSPATAALVVKYVRTAKPLLTEPDDIDLYALSLAQLSFMDAWAYQRSFPEGSNTRERLLGKIVAWCLMPTPKQEPLAQLLAFSLSSYELSSLYAFALPSQLPMPPLSSINTHVTSTSAGSQLSSHAISILQDLLCVRAIQSGDYVLAIKLDRQFSSVSPSLGTDTSSSIASQHALSTRDAIDRRSLIQDLFATLPPAERTLLEDEIGKVAAGVRVNTPSTLTPRQSTSSARRPLVAESSLSASWEDVGASTAPPVLSISATVSPSAAGVGPSAKAATPPVSTVGEVSHPTFSVSTSASPFASRVPQPSFSRQAPPTPKFTAFGSPIPSTIGVSTKGVITERAKTLFSSSAASSPVGIGRPATRVSLFDTAGSSKGVQNAFYKPSSTPTANTLIDLGNVLASSTTAQNIGQDADSAKQNGEAPRRENIGEDMSVVSTSDVEIAEEGRRDVPDGGEEEGAATEEDEDDAENFLTYDKSFAGNTTLHTHRVYETAEDGHGAEPELGFSVFGGGKKTAQNGSAGGQEKKNTSANGRASHISPPRHAPVSPPREGGKRPRTSTSSTPNRLRAPPGAFHPEGEDADEDGHMEYENENDIEEEDEDGHPPQTTPIRSTRRSARLTETPPLASARSHSQHNSKDIAMTISDIDPLSTRSRRTPSRPIPGTLIDEDNDEYERDDADYMDTHGDVDSKEDQREEEDDGIGPLPSRSSRRTRSSGLFDVSTGTKTNIKASAPAKATGAGNATKGKAKARPSETKTPTRRSSRLSMASPTSPDHADGASPTKGRRGTGPRSSIAGSGSGTVATRSSVRRKR